MSKLEVIVGPMFSGKTEELLRRLRRESIAGRGVFLIKPKIDDRYGASNVKTHSGESFPAKSLNDSTEVYEFINSIFPSKDGEDRVIGIDEGQFFDDGLVDVIQEILSVGNFKIIICGLDKDFAAQNFGPIPRLMVLADNLDKLTSICNSCGSDDGSFTQRIVDGLPAQLDGPIVLIGGTESYEARCRSCYNK